MNTYILTITGQNPIRIQGNLETAISAAKRLIPSNAHLISRTNLGAVVHSQHASCSIMIESLI